MDRALKQRLVGASVIIALAVVVLPMLLSGKPETGVPETQKIEMPARPGELSFETRKFPVGESQGSDEADTGNDAEPSTRLPQVEPVTSAAAPEAGEGAEPPGEATTSPQTSPLDGAPAENVAGSPDEPELPVDANASSAPAASVPLDGESESSAADSVPSPSGSAPGESVVEPEPVAAPGGSGRYLVQVASLGSAANASALEKSLEKLGFPVVMDAVDSDVGRLNRVRVGPYATETEAATASARIGKAVSGVNPRVIDLTPEQTASVTTPADPLVRWVVQIGSFNGAENAQKLVEQLRGKGMSSYREEVTSSSATVYRVRVGPFLDRADALRAREVLSKEFGLDGVVMSAD